MENCNLFSPIFFSSEPPTFIRRLKHGHILGYKELPINGIVIYANFYFRWRKI